MEECVLVARSITYAQRMCRVLEREGLFCRYFRPPAALTQGGCGYGVRLRREDLEAGLAALAGWDLLPKRIFEKEGESSYRELSPTRWRLDGEKGEENDVLL